ncbi:hypothetical protein BHE74_00006582 [Ensete ventricosum]|nr:hypothetical protein BHE74_00006582 [Ensete ventricosum]
MAPGQGGQQQFRYTQTPLKVLHVRNLPWECTEEELVALCEPFGRIINTMCNVGANNNQAFVEFVFLLGETTCALGLAIPHKDVGYQLGLVGPKVDFKYGWQADTGVPSMPQAPSLPTTSGWQVYPQPTSTYVGSDFGATGQATNRQGQMLTWNSSMSGGSFVSEPNMFPGQTIATAPVSHYPVSANTSRTPAGPLQALQNSSHDGVMSNTRPASSPTTRPLYDSS